MSHDRPTAVVTGASKGIGRAIALRLVEAGYAVLALARSAEDLQSLEAQAKPQGEIVPLLIDVANEDELLAGCGRILAEHGAPAVLVNNAGVARSAALARTTLEDFDQMMSINVRAPFLFCRQLMPAMVKAGGGRVINLASTAAIKGFKYTSAYCASKHALLGLTRSLAIEFAPKKVTVNALCPGWTDTSMLTRTADTIAQTTGRTHDEARHFIELMNPMGRLVQPEEVAELCVFLASPAAAAVTGACYVMDGGESV